MLANPTLEIFDHLVRDLEIEMFLDAVLDDGPIEVLITSILARLVSLEMSLEMVASVVSTTYRLGASRERTREIALLLMLELMALEVLVTSEG